MYHPIYRSINYSSSKGIINFIVEPHNDQLPVGLIAQLVDYCTGIKEVRV